MRLFSFVSIVFGFLGRVVANKISRVVILTAAFFLAVSAVWQAFRSACAPAAHYGICNAASYFYWGWLYDYQTLLTGLLALAGAWWGVRAINMQVTQEARREAERMASRRAAARATLPLSLSLLCRYAEECASILKDLLDKCVDGALPRTVDVKEFPDPPAEAIQAFKEMTEVSVPADRETLAVILGEIQVQRAKISSIASGFHGMFVPVTTLEEYIIDTAEIYARSIALYKYARRKSGSIPSPLITTQARILALRDLGIYDELFDRLVTTLRRRETDPLYAPGGPLSPNR